MSPREPVHISQLCALTRVPIARLLQQHLSQKPPVPYVIAKINGVIYDAFSLHTEERGISQLRSARKIDYHVSKDLSGDFQPLKIDFARTFCLATNLDNTPSTLQQKKDLLATLLQHRMLKECYDWTEIVLSRARDDPYTLKIQAEIIFDNATPVQKTEKEKLRLIRKLLRLEPGSTELRQKKQSIEQKIDASRPHSILPLPNIPDITRDVVSPLPDYQALVSFFQTKVGGQRQAIELLSDLFKLDDELETSRQIRELITHLIQILEHDPKNYFARSRLGVCLSGLLPDIAIRLFRECIQINPNDAYVYGRLAVLIKNEHIDEAIALFNTALEKEPEQVYSLKYYGKLCRKTNPAKAKNLLDRAHVKNPNDHIVIENLAEIERIHGNLDIAKTLFETALAIQNTYFTLSRLAEIHRSQNDIFPAKAYFEWALRIKPTSCYALGRLGTLLFLYEPHIPKDLPTAKMYLETAYNKYPNDPVILGYYGEFLRRTADDRLLQLLQAKELLQKAHDLSPSDSFISSCLGAVLLQPGLNKDRLQANQLLASPHPLARAPEASVRLPSAASAAEIRDQVANNRARAADLLQALQQEKTDGDDAFILIGLAQLQLSGNGISANPGLARDNLIKALRSDPNNITALLLLAEIYRTGGNHTFTPEPGRAITVLIQALDLDERNIEIKTNLALLLKETNPSKAHTLIDQVLREQPTFAKAVAIKGELLRLDGKIKDAKGFLEKALTLNDKNADCLVSLSLLYSSGGEGIKPNHAFAEQYKKRALQLDPFCFEGVMVEIPL